MKLTKFLLSLIATIGLTWFLNTSQNVKGAPIPALGSLFSPFQGYWRNGKSLTDKPSDEMAQGIKNNVKVVYDDRQVPHIFAENVEDALFVQGFLHAQNRLWEMDFITRAAGGRLSEVLGDRPIRLGLSTIDVDKIQRRRGLIPGAEKTVKEWQADPETWALVTAYCMGANAYIAKLDPRDYPLEYKIFGVKPEQWTPLHMSLLATYMALDLALGESDVQATNAKALFGNDFDFIYPEYFPEQQPVVPVGTNFGTAPAEKDATSTIMSDKITPLSMIDFPSIHEDLQPDASNGSNNWVVGPSKTKNKNPILCGDPHLSLKMPSIWYEIQISTPDMNVYGVSLPGLPAVIIGFNDNIAWTQTNVGQDVADWYSMKWLNPNRTEYQYDGTTRKVDLRVEDILVKGVGIIKDTVKYTVWGPVVFDNDTMPNANMAFHWLANDVSKSSIKTFVQLNKAKNYDEYAKALEGFNVPAQNFAFACKNGDIALHLGGTFPKKAKGQGRFVQDGSNSANAWKGFIPKSMNPHYKNPARGFVSSANQHSTDPSYPYYFNSENFDTYRGRIVNQKLSKMDTITIEAMKKMQNDNFSLMAQEALPIMLNLLDTAALSTDMKQIVSELSKWDYYYEANKSAPIYFEEWFKFFYDEVWDEILSRTDKSRILKPTTWRTIAILRGDANNKFFDKIASSDKKETAKDLLITSFKSMMAEIPKIQAEISKNYPKTPQLIWANYKDTEIPHISNMPGLGRSHIANGGYGKAINAIKKNHGPSWRMIVEMTPERPRAFVVYPGGQSGNPGSKYYDQFVDSWSKGNYYEAIFMRKADEKLPTLTLTQEFKKVQ
ncbi:MAG: penicillin acylase family protein [Saprospiraceae bacterium]|nr:penicillin acylase family protein [Saprospiraceae bacterium]